MSPFGVTLNESDGNYWFNGKPLAGLRDRRIQYHDVRHLLQKSARLFSWNGMGTEILRAFMKRI